MTAQLSLSLKAENWPDRKRVKAPCIEVVKCVIPARAHIASKLAGLGVLSANGYQGCSGYHFKLVIPLASCGVMDVVERLCKVAAAVRDKKERVFCPNSNWKLLEILSFPLSQPLDTLLFLYKTAQSQLEPLAGLTLQFMAYTVHGASYLWNSRLMCSDMADSTQARQKHKPS